MKRFSTQILLGYIIITIIFIIGNFLFFYSIRLYFLKEINSGLNSIVSFIEHEIAENKTKPSNIIISEILKEVPLDNTVNLFITFKGVKYSSFNNVFKKKSPKKPSNFEKFINIDNSYFLEKQLFLKNKEYINILLIKDMTDTKETLIKIFEKLILFLFIILFLTLIIIRTTYKGTLKQLEILKKATNSVSLDSFKTTIDKSEFYSEFYNIISAYEEMQHRLQKQSKLQVDFINSASHELKTPIFIISGYINLISSGKITDKKILSEAVEAVKHEVKEMGILIEKLLFIAKQDNVTLDIEPFSIVELINEISEEINIIYNFNKINIIGDNFQIYTDRKLFKQLLRNIIENGVKYGLGNNLDIYISKFEKVKISIQDYGVGIKENELEFIFNKFYRGTTNNFNSTKGHGLGLSISKAIVDILGGSITVSSVFSKGSVVTIII